MTARAPPGSLVQRFAGYLLAAGCGFYLTQVVSVSPIYVLVGLSMILATASAIEARSAVTRPLVPWALLGVLVLQFGTYLFHVSPLNSGLGYLLNFVALALAGIVFCQISTAQLWWCRGILVWTTIVLGSAEAVVRFVFPFQDLSAALAQHVALGVDAFYAYKFNSIMYQDSNFVGMWLLVIFLFQLYSARLGQPIERVQSIMLFALLCLTVCRAAIFAAVVIVAFRLFWRPGWRWNRVVVAVGGSLIVIGAVIFFRQMAEDGSLQSKLLIFDLATHVYAAYVSPAALLFGGGIVSSTDTLEALPHTTTSSTSCSRLARSGCSQRWRCTSSICAVRRQHAP